jgi:hypothetical protein
VLAADVDEVLEAGVEAAVLVVAAEEVVLVAAVEAVVLVAGVVEVELVDELVDAFEPIKVWLNAWIIACINCEPPPERSARLPPSSSPP